MALLSLGLEPLNTLCIRFQDGLTRFITGRLVGDQWMKGIWQQVIPECDVEHGIATVILETPLGKPFRKFPRCGRLMGNRPAHVVSDSPMGKLQG